MTDLCRHCGEPIYIKHGCWYHEATFSMTCTRPAAQWASPVTPEEITTMSEPTPLKPIVTDNRDETTVQINVSIFIDAGHPMLVSDINQTLGTIDARIRQALERTPSANDRTNCKIDVTKSEFRRTAVELGGI